MQIYVTKSKRIPGTKYREVYDSAFWKYEQIKKQSKRRPYIRSVYFSKQKIFIDLFKTHLHQKNWRDRARRARFFPAAIELLRNSRIPPISKQNPNKKHELLHRFKGKTSDGHIFCVQIREDKRTGNKSLFSVFPKQKE